MHRFLSAMFMCIYEYIFFLRSFYLVAVVQFHLSLHRSGGNRFAWYIFAGMKSDYISDNAGIIVMFQKMLRSL